MGTTSTDHPNKNFSFDLQQHGIDQGPFAIERRVFAKGDQLFAEGDAARFFFKVNCGAVRTSTLLLDARRQVDAFHFADEIFGYETTGKHSYTADAIQNTVVETFRQSHFQNLLKSCPALADELMMATLASLHRSRTHMFLLARRGSKERIVTFLLELSARLKTDRLELVMQRADIADHLGLTRETVSRTLTSLASDELIFLECATRIVLRNKTGLRQLLLVER